MSRTGIPSVIAITVSTPESIASSIAGRGEARRHEDHRGVGAGLGDGLLDRVEDRHALDVLAALAGGDAGDEVGPVGLVAQPVEGALAAGQAGDGELRLAADDDAHAAPPASSTTRRAASSIVFSWCRLGRSASARIARPSSELVPSRRTTSGRPRSSWLRGGDDPLGDLVAAGDATEDVEEDRGHLRVGLDHFQRVDDRLGFGAAAGVEEVGRGAARLGDDVERRHAETGAVGEDADVAVELDVGEALLLRHLLLRDRRPCRRSRPGPGGGRARCRRS